MISLETFKAHLNLDKWYTDEDELLIVYLNAAQNAVEAMINGGNGDEFNDKDCSTELPSRVDILVLLVAAEFYQNREVNVTSNLKNNPLWNYLVVPATNFDTITTK